MARSIYDLTTEEAYRLVADHFGHPLPPLDAVENEDWGRDYVMQHFMDAVSKSNHADVLSCLTDDVECEVDPIV